MLLNADEIRNRGLVASGASTSSYRASTYDVTVGLILTPSGKKLSSLTLRPQEIAVVVSRETLRIPIDVSGHAVPRTSLAEQGLLALSTGVVDPGYEGPLSSVVINFGSEDLKIHEGTPFLRVFFQPISAPSNLAFAETEPRDEYIRRRRSRAQQLPGTFLDLPNQAKAIADQIASARTEKLVGLLSAVGVFLVVVAFFGAPFVGQMAGRDSLSVADVRALQELETAQLRDDIGDLDAAVSQLEVAAAESSPDRVAVLEAAISELAKRLDAMEERVAEATTISSSEPAP